MPNSIAPISTAKPAPAQVLTGKPSFLPWLGTSQAELGLGPTRAAVRAGKPIRRTAARSAIVSLGFSHSILWRPWFCTAPLLPGTQQIASLVSPIQSPLFYALDQFVKSTSLIGLAWLELRRSRGLGFALLQPTRSVASKPYRTSSQSSTCPGPGVDRTAGSARRTRRQRRSAPEYTPSADWIEIDKQQNSAGDAAGFGGRHSFARCRNCTLGVKSDDRIRDRTGGHRQSDGNRRDA